MGFVAACVEELDEDDAAHEGCPSCLYLLPEEGIPRLLDRLSWELRRAEFASKACAQVVDEPLSGGIEEPLGRLDDRRVDRECCGLGVFFATLGV